MDQSQRSLEILNTIHSQMKSRILRVFEDVSRTAGFRMRATSGLRSMSDQLALWRAGRDEEGKVVDEKAIVTHAAPGSSFHNFGLALDVCFEGKDPYWELLQVQDPLEAAFRWSEFGRFSVAHGLEWGGNFTHLSDKPHVQMSMGMTLRQIQDIYKFGGLDAVFKKVDSLIKGG
jgi:peptidoglycan LD-endopeptidase CwlK